MTDSLEAFLNTYKKSTRGLYKRGLTLFVSWSGKAIDTILKERKEDVTLRPNENLVDYKFRSGRYERELEKFHAWLLEHDYKINSARSYCMSVMQLFRYYGMILTLRAGSPISQTVVSVGDFVLMPEHVRRMFHTAKDLRSKLIISMASDLGWRVGDFITIKVEELPNLNLEPPIEWVRMTKKEKVVAKSCLSKTSVELLKEYLFTYGIKKGWLWYSNGSHISDDTINRRLKDLAVESGIELGNLKLSFHCFRDLNISQAKNLGIDPDIIKLMVGKSVKKDMLPYLTGIDVRTAFKKLQTITRINGELLSKESEDHVVQLGKMVSGMKQRMETLEDKQQLLLKLFKAFQKYGNFHIEIPEEDQLAKDIYKLLKKLNEQT